MKPCMSRRFAAPRCITGGRVSVWPRHRYCSVNGNSAASFSVCSVRRMCICLHHMRLLYDVSYIVITSCVNARYIRVPFPQAVYQRLRNCFRFVYFTIAM